MEESAMAADSLKFGTSGLRGLVTDLVGPASRRYALAFIDYLKQKGEVADGGFLLVGRDLRDSSPAITAAVIGAARHAGLTPVDCGALPTPALALESLRRQAPAIMVTGSHIPADRNGLKFYTARGEIEKQDEAGILAALGDAGFPDGEVGETDGGALARYEERYAGLLPADALKDRVIGVYQHSSVARDLMVRVLERFGARTVALGRSEAFVPVDTEALSAADAEQAANWAREHRLDALVSTDGDADRPLVADEIGSFIRGDVLGLLTAQFLGADGLATPVTSNSAIEAIMPGARVVRTKVGSPYVIAGMAEAAGLGARRIVGFEANGGVLLASDVPEKRLTALPTRDAVLPILAVLGLANGRRLSQVVGALPPRFARSGRLEHVPAEKSTGFMASLLRNAGAFFQRIGSVESASDTDGLRFMLSSGEIVHFRPSGNAPELRCYTEAATPARAEELLEWGLEAAEAEVRR
jgi:phosphomannomutase